MNIEDVHKNTKVLITGIPYNIDDADFMKPGKGHAIYRLRLRNLLDNGTIEHTYHSGERVEEANISISEMQYLYKEEGKYCFMDNESYEQIFLSEDQVGEAKNFLLDNIEAEILLFEDRPLGISLPNFIDVIVTKADPWAKGDSVSGNTKPVTVQTGYQVQVPPFIEEGEKIRIDTRSGEYLTRVKG